MLRMNTNAPGTSGRHPCFWWEYNPESLCWSRRRWFDKPLLLGAIYVLREVLPGRSNHGARNGRNM